MTMQLADQPLGSRISVSRGYGWKTLLIVSSLLFAGTAAVFWPACKNGFVNWDDNSYVCNRLEVLNGINWKGVLWAMTAEVCGNWHPLTVISLQLDAQLFGTSPIGFHRTAVLLHALNAAIAFLTICTLTGCPWRSAIVAALFALHPLRVESVAWISERKDLLSGFFFFLTLLAYGRYAASPSVGRYIPVASCLVLGLSSKSMLVTTPCVLLLLDYWPLARVGKRSTHQLHDIWYLVLEKIPLFGLSALSSAFTVLYQGAAISSLTQVPLVSRIENAVVSYVTYLRQSCCPVHLSPYYSNHEVPIREFGAALVLLIGLTVLSIWQRNRHPYILVGWFWFLGMLVPVSGIIQVGSQAHADRYTYLPQIGLFLAVVWSLAEFCYQSRWLTIASTCVFTVFLAGCGIVTYQQIPVWRNTVNLWRRAYSLQPQDTYVVQNLIRSLINNGNKFEAIQLTHDVLQVTSESDCEKMVMLAMLLAVEGEHEKCAETLTKAIQHFPQKAELYSNRGKALGALGKWQQAVDDYRKSSKLAPGSVSFRFYLAHSLKKIGQDEEARRIFSEALQQSPHWPQNAARDAWRMATSPDFRDRVDFWPICLAEQAIEATGVESAPYLDVLAAAYAHAGRFDEAIVIAKKAIQQAEQTKQTAFANIIGKRLKLYELGLPYRDPSSGAIPTP